MKVFRPLLLGLLASTPISPLLLAEPARALSVGPGLSAPLAYPDTHPTFSWKLAPGTQAQTAYRVQADLSGDRHWDSGWIESSQSLFVPYSGPSLHARDRLTWRVNVQDEHGKESGWSPASTLEIGLQGPADWSAHWIRPSGETPAEGEPVATLRRRFVVGKAVREARLHITARGLFEVSLNDARISADHFANGFTAYDRRLDVLTYDVSSQLHPGENQIQSLLGTGWYAGRLPFAAKQRGPYGKDVALLAQLEIHYTDGTTETIGTDQAWEGSYEGPLRSSSLYDGEQVDARQQIEHWAPVLVEASLGSARLEPKPFAPVREELSLHPIAVSSPQPGRFIFDLGQNMVGWARLHVPVLKDRLITVHFAEMLREDGTLYTDNYRGAKSTDTYLPATSGQLDWEPHFTFHGFRYVELSGLPEDAQPRPEWVEGVVLHSDLPSVGQFSSSHAKLNQLQSNITWGWRGNSLDIPTDCPQRDERMGWTGDAQVFCATSLFNTDALAFWKSWLESLRDNQYADGGIPPFVPDTHSKWKTYSPGWLDAATIIPWETYVHTGDLSVLSENFALMEGLVGWYRSHAKEHLLTGVGGFGDWLQPYPQAQATKEDGMRDRRGDTPFDLIGTAYYAHSAQILADSARFLHRDAEAKRYGEEARQVREAFTRAYFDEQGRTRAHPETQTAYVLALSFHLLPEALRAQAGNHLARLVHQADDHLRTGFLGTSMLTQALTETGHADLAARVLFQESYPSWFYPLNQGATTMWERWNSYTRDKGFGDVAMNSFNHYAYGAIGQWLYERVAGLAPDPEHPGYRHLLIQPLIVAQLTSARAELETPYGRALSSWEKRDGKVLLDLIIPPNCTATLRFPDSAPARTVPAGSHHFEATLP